MNTESTAPSADPNKRQYPREVRSSASKERMIAKERSAVVGESDSVAANHNDD